jgi:flagellar protein FliO/FliZ
MRRSRPSLAIVAMLSLWPRLAYAAAGQPQGMGMLVLKSTVALAIVLALFALVIWGMRRLQGGLANQGARILTMESRISLDTRNSVAIVRHGKQRWLLGISPSGITRIDSLEDPAVTGSKEPA